MATRVPASAAFENEQDGRRKDPQGTHQGTLAIETDIEVIGLVVMSTAISVRRHDSACLLIQAAANIASKGPLRGQAH